MIRLHSADISAMTSLLLAILLLAPFAAAQSSFRPGDRVEVDEQMASDPGRGSWQAGVVRSVSGKEMTYTVLLDGCTEAVIAMQSPEKWIRPASKATRQEESSPACSPATVRADQKRSTPAR